MKICTCQFVEATTLVPKNWRLWFWQAISEDALFKLGDNNRSLVTAEVFANHCEEAILMSGYPNAKPCAVRQWLKKIRALGQMYIDLEN